MTHPPTIRTASESQTVGVVGDVYRYLATGEDTGGQFALLDAIVGPGGGPPPHIHRREQESFYILEGEVTVFVDGQPQTARPGTFVNVPIGTLHAFKNETDKLARMLISVVPAGLEKMFLECGTQLPKGTTSCPQPTHEEIEKLLAVAPKYGVEIKLPHG